MKIFPLRHSASKPTEAFQNPSSERHPWSLVWHGLFYLELVIAALLSMTQPPLPLNDLIWQALLALFFAVWYLVSIIVPRSLWHSRVLLTQGYLIIGWLLWLLLTYNNPPYGIVIPGLVTQLSLLARGRWKIPGFFILALFILWNYAMAAWLPGAASIIFSTTILVGMLLAFQFEQIYRQYQEKDRLLQELKATREELAEAARQVGIAQERQRLAHEIHDTLAQGFTAIIMQTEAAPQVDEPESRFQAIQRLARANLSEVRRIMWALQPEALMYSPLPKALNSFIAEWSRESGIEVRITIIGDEHTLLPEIKMAILRATQEALSNVRKHAHAHTVTITLSYMDDIITLDVQDDGIGFTPEDLPLQPDAGCFGLKALYKRATQLQGHFYIESTPGTGTTLALELPALEPETATKQKEPHTQ